jgi:hypothetical protein
MINEESFCKMTSMKSAAEFLKMNYGNTVNIENFSKESKVLINKLIEYGYLLFKSKNVYFISLKSGQMTELSKKIEDLSAFKPQHVTLNQNEQKKSNS